MLERMYVAHQTYIANGGQLLSYYVYSGAGPWDFANDRVMNTVADTVKLQAIDAIRLTRKSAPTLGAPVPGTVWVQDPAVFRQNYGGAAGSWGYGGQAIRLGPNSRGPAFADSVVQPIRTTLAGVYSFSIRTYDAPANARVELLVNGNSIGTWTLAASNTSQPVSSATLRAALPAGLSVVRVRPVNNTVWVRDLVVQ